MVKYEYASTVARGPQPGTVALQRAILQAFPGAISAGIYNNRFVRGSKARLSLHAEGRATDITPKDQAQGMQIRDWAFEHREEWQIQEIIYCRKIWSALHPASGWRDYSGVNAHLDHVHIGQNWQGANKK